MNSPRSLDRHTRRGGSWRVSAGVIGAAIGIAGSVGLQIAGLDRDAAAFVASASAPQPCPAASAVPTAI